MATTTDKYFADRHVLLEPIPGQAHWQISIVEEAMDAIKMTMTHIAKEQEETTWEFQGTPFRPVRASVFERMREVKRSRNVRVQGPVTYKRRWQRPRFVPHTENDWGAWSD